MIWAVILMGCLPAPPLEYADEDGDGYGDASTPVATGEGVPGSSSSFDCDDTDPTRFPNQTWALDCDGDGAYHPVPLADCAPTDGCEAVPLDTWPEGVPDRLDCDDTDPALTTDTLWFADCDGDGVSSDTVGITACGEAAASAIFDCDNGEDPAAWLTVGGNDCDDTEASGTIATEWYPDCDGDGVYSATAVSACGISGANAAFDCADGNNPPGDASWSATIGDDCNDEDADNSVIRDWYPDCDDDDEHSSVGVSACTPTEANQQFNCQTTLQPPGEGDEAWVTLAGSDCDDENSAAFAVRTWYPDCDDDAVFAHIGVDACGEASAAAAFNCTDGFDPSVWSNTLGTDCDDEDATGVVIESWYADCDDDGVVARDPVMACGETGADTAFDCDDGLDPDAWTTTQGTDCDDEDDQQFPGQVWYADCDADGVFSPSGVTQCDEPTPCTTSANPPTGGWSRVAPSVDDCNDEEALSFPGATEHCDGIRNNCEDATWTNDRGIVSFEATSNGLWSDVSESWQGVAGSPATVSTLDAGVFHVCRDTWFVDLSFTDVVGVSVVGEDPSNTVLSGGESTSVGNFVRAQVDLSNLTVRDGRRFQGAGLTLTSSQVVLDNVLLRNNVADNRGGAAYLDALSTLSLTNTEAVSNAAPTGGAVYVNGGSLTVVDSNIHNNSGTALHWDGGTGDVRDTTLANNVDNASGAMSVDGAVVVVDTSVLRDNEAMTDRAGAARVVGGGRLTLIDSTVSGNVAAAGAGALMAFGGDLILTRTDVDDNYSIAGNGGAILVDDNGTNNGTLVATGGSFTNSGFAPANGRGGAVYGRGTAEITLTDLTIDNGQAQSGGALSLTQQASAILDNVEVSSCSGVAFTLDSNQHTRFIGGLIRDSVEGGGVSVGSNATVSFADTSFDNNGAYDLFLNTSAQQSTLGANVTLACDASSCE